MNGPDDGDTSDGLTVPRPDPEPDPGVNDIVTDELRAQLSRHNPAADFTDRELDLRRDLKADELDLVTIAMELEERLGIEVTDQEIEQTETIGQLHSLIERKAK